MIRGARIRLVVALLAMAWALHADAATGGRRIVVSIPPQKFLAQRIGGDKVNVQVMLEPGHAPETFEPTPRQMAGVAGADFYFSIGVPFEEAWLPELQKQNPKLQVIECCRQFLQPADQSAGYHDPHIWVSPMGFLHEAALMRATLLSRDVGNRRMYDQTYRTLSAELVMLNRDLRYLLKDRRIDEFIISHAALGPLAQDQGLKQIALESGGKEVGPKTLAEITATARRLGIRTVFVVKQHNQGPARALARELNAELVEIDPLAENYIDNMRNIGRLLGAATR
jgi:zinc transport system substrate-binding protein